MTTTDTLTARQRSQLFHGSSVALIATALCFAIRGDVLDAQAADFALTKEEIGWTASTAFWGFTVAMILGGPLCDRVGMKPLLGAAFVMHLAGVLGTALSQGFWSLYGATLAIEGPDRVPAGWHALVEGQTDMILGPQRLARMGFHAPARGLFGARGEQVMSMAMVRVAMWEPARQGVLAFGSPDANGFAEDMGAELVAFLARVVERTAERWPVL